MSSGRVMVFGDTVQVEASRAGRRSWRSSIRAYARLMKNGTN